MNIDEMIAKALEEEFEERVEQSSTDTKKHRFSLAYRLWERKTLRDLRRGSSKHWTLKRARMVVASGFASLAVLIGGAAFAAVNLGRYSFVDKTDYSKMLIENHPSDKTSLEEYYGLPEEDGWELVNYDIMFNSTTLNYKYNDKIVSFTQSVIGGYISNVNTENTVVEPMSIYEENDAFFIAFQGGDCGLFWIYDGYLFNILGNITKGECTDLAYSTKIINL